MMIARANTSRSVNNSAHYCSKLLWIKLFVLYSCLFSAKCIASSPASRYVLLPSRGGRRTIVRNNNNGPELMVVEKDNGANKNRYSPVVLVALSNAIINIMRPDDQIPWPLRIPRVFWEVSIMTTANVANNLQSSTVVHLLMALILGSTALVDIFVWAPVFAFMIDFKTCSGGWFSSKPRQCVPDLAKGYGRLVGVGQSLFGGLFYLAMALVAWNEYVALRDDVDVAKQLYVLDAFDQSRQQRQQENSKD